MNTKIINQDTLIRMISSSTHLTLTSVRKIFNELENIITNNALVVDENNALQIKLFNGLNIEAHYDVNNKYFKGAEKPEELTPAPKLKLRLSHTYRSKLKELYNQK